MTETMQSFAHVVVIDKCITGMFQRDASSVSSVVTTARYISESRIQLVQNFICFCGQWSYQVNAVKFNDSSAVVVSAGFDRSLRVWDCRSHSVEPVQVFAPFLRFHGFTLKLKLSQLFFY